jgi:hypothetical protein
MIKRCHHESCKAYRWYGAKGVKVCDAWRAFVEFREWAESSGYHEGLTIDRERSDRDYCPENCHWRTMSANSSRAQDVFRKWTVTAFGETKSVEGWLKDPRCLVKKASTLRNRIIRGLTGIEVLTKPVKPRKGRKV